MSLPADYYRAGVTSDGKGFVTLFGNEPVFRSFDYNPGYDMQVALARELEKLDVNSSVIARV
ncbi:MAG: hypothetical protein J6Y02_10130 [Pseudobutyrivibrio sp.]|nr:hypothetical protein [Pseudobutyrivibrio sp.]